MLFKRYAFRIFRITLSPVVALGLAGAIWVSYLADVINGVFDD